MQNRRSVIDSPIVKWSSFLLLLAVVAVWAVRGVLLRGDRMGKAEDIVPGAIVQISGTLDANHALQTNQIVILTGYVHLSETAR